MPLVFFKTDKIITQTIVFADIAGSTSLYEKAGDIEAEKLISEKINRMIASIHAEKGIVVKTIGDEILCRFGHAKEALFAAKKIQYEQSFLSDGLKVRIGLHSGDVILKNNDVFGDTVNVAARMVGLAKAGQILCTKHVLDQSFTDSRLLQSMMVKGKSMPLEVHEVLMDAESADLTMMLISNQVKSSAARAEGSKGSQLIYQQHIFYLQNYQALLLGREAHCDICLEHKMVSREHAKIEIRSGRVMLHDTSTNGTFYKPQGKSEMMIHQEAVTLTESGMFSLGLPIEENTEYLIQLSLNGHAP